MRKNITFIFLANFFSLLSGVVTSLLTAWSLGPEGRGDLAIVTMYPNVVALAIGLGLPQAHRYFLAREPEEVSPMFSNALIFTVVAGALSYFAAEFFVPLLIGERSEAVMWLVRIYLLNIPLSLLYDLMAGMLEGSRQFKWAAIARVMFFGVQSAVYFVLWMTGNLTVYTAALTMIAAQIANALTATFSVSRVLRPRWQPSWTSWVKFIKYGLKYHVGVVTSFTTLRLDQLMLGGMATSIEIGLYVVAVRLSEITTVLSSSIADVLMPEVAAAKHSKNSTQLLTKSLRQMFYMYLLMIVPLMIVSPFVLEYAFGADFAAATNTLRLLLAASMMWSLGAIINSGLNGFGYPGLSTISKLASAAVTVFALLYWLPIYGINGAALASLLGYSTMFAVALFWLIRKKDIRLREIFIYQSGDIPVRKIMTTLQAKFGLVKQTNDIGTEDMRCFHKLFEAQAAANPDHTAIICNGESLTYGELNARANQLAHHLRFLGVQIETLVPICVDRSIEMAVGILGILKSGAAYVPIDPAYPADRIEFMLADTAADLLVTQSGISFATDAKKVLLDAEWEEIAGQSIENPVQKVNAENLAYVIYTSGSTGKPKGAMMTHANLYHYVCALQQEFKLTADDKYLHLASIAFSSSRRHLLFPLAHGASVVIADEDTRMDALPLFNLIKKKNVTIFDAVPSFQRHCLNALTEIEKMERDELLSNDLRLIVSASEPLLSDIPAAWMFEFKHPARHVHMIGQTETSGIISINRITEQDARSAIRPVPVGHPIADTEILLLDENLQPVVAGEAGEIFVSGNGLGRGYLNRPELNEHKFVELKLENGDAPKRFCRTGDFAKMMPDGRLECLGRQDFQVKIRGFRVELGELEALILGHADVLSCAVIGREDASGQINLIAYIVSRSKSSAVTNELRALVKTKLPDYMQIAAFIEMDALPLTPNGKTDRKGLAQLPPPTIEKTGDENKIFVAPRNSTEQIIAGIWAGILGHNHIGVDDDFFDLGGHSLSASRVIACLRTAFNADIPLRAIFEAPTIARLAARISLCLNQTNARDQIVSGEHTQAIPLSFSQQRLWFLSQLESDSSTYNMSQIIRLEGAPNEFALRCALKKVTERHEILRTTFEAADGEPFQKISADAMIDFSVTDLTASMNESSREKSLEIAAEYVARPFDLSVCPLLRVNLLKLSAAESLLVVVFHHIISDGWSIGIFLKELADFYQAKLLGRGSSLPVLPIQFADYASWQHQWMQTGEYTQQLEFWKAHLTGAPALIDLPTDYPRPAVQRYHGAQIKLEVGSELTGKIKSLSRSANVTAFMTLMSAWQVLLKRYSSQDDIVVGTPIAGRTKTETENLIGFFVNTLPVRGDLSGNPTFKELLARTRSTALDAYANQEMPFEKLVEEINPERSLSYSPIFQTMFALQNFSAAGDTFADLKATRVKLPSQTAKFDLSLDVYEEADGYELWLEYDTNLFAPETAEQMLAHYSRILESVADDVERKLSDIQILTAVEEHQLLDEWNVRAVEIPNVCFHQLIEAQAEKNPEAIAVVWKDERLTYGDLNARANQLAHYLQAQGAKPETIVGIYVERSPEMLIALLGVLKAGAAYLPLDPNYPAERLQHMTTDAEVSVLITQKNLFAKAQELSSQSIVCIDDNWSSIALESAVNPICAATPDNLAYVIFTSGSTGKSKGVMVTHRNVVNAYVAWEEAYEISKYDSHLQMASFSFDVFTGDLARALCSGAKLVLCPSELLLESEQLEKLLRDEQIESAEFVPAVVRPLTEHLENSGRILETLKFIAVGSDIWQMEEYRRLKNVCRSDARVVSSYGVTEATIDSTFFEMRDKHSSDQGIVPIGRPFANTQLYLLDQNQNLVPPGVPGELYLGGAGVARGYLKRPELTKEKFAEWTTPNGKKLNLYRTGDIARYARDGVLEIQGRADNQVKLRGYRIELGEIEAVLSKHPRVNEPLVIVREDAPGDKRLVAYFTSENAPEVSELRAHVKSLLPDYMTPSAFVLVSEWKLTPNGKIDRKRLPVPDNSIATNDRQYVAPRNPIEEKLAEIWANLLRCERVGAEDNFFDLGGHSLLATQIVSRIRDAFGQTIPLRMMFETPTVANLAEYLSAHNAAETVELETAEISLDSVEQAELEILLAELENVSDEEAERLLAGEAKATYI